METLRPEILIIGAGISGCAFAMECALGGMDVLLVERDLAPRRQFKGEYLQPGAADYLRGLGFGPFLDSKSISSVTQLRFTDLDKNGKLEAGVTMQYPTGYSARSAEHHVLLGGMREKMAAVLGPRFWRGAELKAVNPRTEDFSEHPVFECFRANEAPVRVEPRWVIGCDGRQSNVRYCLGGRAAAKNGRVVLGAPQEMLLGALWRGRSDYPEHYEVIRSPERGTLSIFAVGEAGSRIYLSSPVLEPGEKLLPKFERAFSPLKDRLGLGSLQDLRPVGHPAHTEWLGPASMGRVLLVGDALAVTTPYGGQGMTQALEHVAFLAQAFADPCVSEAERKSLAAAYPVFAREVFQRINLLNFGLYSVFFSRSRLLRGLGHKVLRNWEANPQLKQRVARLFGGIDRDMPTLVELLGFRGKPLGKATHEFLARAFPWG